MHLTQSYEWFLGIVEAVNRVISAAVKFVIQYLH